MFERLSQWFHSFLESLSPSRPAPAPIPAPEPVPTPPPSPLPPPRPDARVVDAINAARASAGLLPLVDDRVLGLMARSWAASMASGEILSHGDFSGRITASYPNRAGGEDIAEGQPDAASVVDSWMQSPPHRANILGDFDRLGVGSARDDGGTVFWCADFVRID